MNNMYNEISEYRYYFDHNAWSKYTDIYDRINTDSCSMDWCEQAYGGPRLNEPYLAVNIKDFWDRWHISLTTWFKDYLYFPLGGSKRGKVRKYFNILIVFSEFFVK